MDFSRAPTDDDRTDDSRHRELHGQGARWHDPEAARPGRPCLSKLLRWALRSDGVGRPGHVRQPIHVGELASFLAAVNHAGTTSMEVDIKVIAEDIRTQDKRHVNSCIFTMIAMGDDGRPAEVPALRTLTPDERRRFAAAPPPNAA